MPASFLKIGSERVEDAILESVTAVFELNRHSTCEIECRQTADRRFPIEERLGQDIQVCSSDQSGTETILFDGFILEGRIEYEVFGSFRVRLRAVSRSYKLDATPQERYFRQAKLEDVAKQLCGDDELESKVSCPALDPKNYVQWGETDWSLLLRIADQHKAYILPTPGGIEIRDSFESGATVQWRADDAQGLTSFRLRGCLRPAAVTGVHYEAAAMKSVRLEAVKKEPEWFSGAARMAGAVSKQSAARLPWGYESEDARARDEGEYRALLERMAERNLGSAVVCRGVSRHEGVRAGRTVKVEGVLDAAGEYGVVKVIHRWGKLGYENEFWCTPWKRWMEGEAPRAPRMAGVVVARVVQHDDPKKMGRVQVSYDWQEGGATGWARMALPHAGADRGFMFMPEVGDEVLVAFEQGDVERPYIVGCLWNGVDTAPRDEFWGGELADNDIKRIVTKSGHRIQLVDKPGKEAISIATPNHTRITMYEKAEETGRPAIVVHNETGDIVFTAPQGRIHFQSKYFSREIGVEGGEQKASPPPAKPQPNQAAPAAAPGKSGAAVASAGGVLGAALGWLSAKSKQYSKDPCVAAEAHIKASPKLEQELQKLKQQGWSVRYGEKGAGSYCDRRNKTIIIDGNQLGDPDAVASTLAHEVGHARRSDPPQVPPDGLTKAEYAAKNSKECLLDEADATMFTIEAQREMKGSGKNIEVPGAQAEEYEKIYDKYPEDREKARNEIAEKFGTGEHPSTAPEKTYSEYYSAPFEENYDRWEKSRPPAEGGTGAGR